MSTYVMSDIHGCFDTFQSMLKQIGFSDQDQLILAGDYIDRGPQSDVMLSWLLDPPENVVLLRGNHDEEFAANVDMMDFVLKNSPRPLDPASAKDTRALYLITAAFCKEQGSLFDYYKTMGWLVSRRDAALTDLRLWAKALRSFDFLYRTRAAGRECVIVHAGYIDNLNALKASGLYYNDVREFYIYARDEGYRYGGIPGGMVISGHTPTIAEGRMTFTNGKVFRYHDPVKDCVFYDIDCGCCFHRQDPQGRLAALRLEDEKIFYVTP
ncbi:MAG: metallophosphoesterase [Lachnospiraceae bacterium]|nr:metallophosphoesterase [Lachnospiraceae bacterium]